MAIDPDDLNLLISTDTAPFILKEVEAVPFVLTEHQTPNEIIITQLPSLIGLVDLRGPAGDDGSGSTTTQYTHNQTSSSATWTVNHNLGRFPSSVAVLSPGGQEVEAGVVHISTNQLQVSFAVASTGTVRII